MLELKKRAQEIYDKFHKGHDTSYKPPVLIAETPEAAEKLLEFMSQFKSKREMYIYLTALQRVIEEIRDEELEEKNKIEKNKTKTLEKQLIKSKGIIIYSYENIKLNNIYIIINKV